MPFGAKKLEWRGYQIVKIFDDTFIRFDTTHECDRQTPHDDIGHALAQHRAAKKSEVSQNYEYVQIFTFSQENYNQG